MPKTSRIGVTFGSIATVAASGDRSETIITKVIRMNAEKDALPRAVQNRARPHALDQGRFRADDPMQCDPSSSPSAQAGLQICWRLRSSGTIRAVNTQMAAICDEVAVG